MDDGGTPTRNAREDGDDPERAKLEKKATKRLHAAFRAVQSALFPRSDQIVNPEVVTLRLHGAWGMVHDEVVGMVTEAALMGARFAFSYSTNDLQANEPTITSSWELINEEVLRYVMGDTFQMGEGYATALTQQLLQTSERQIKEAIAAWTRSGDPLPALIRTLERTALSRNRAELIATTEVTRAYAEAARLTWAQGGVIETMRWQTANDELTCDVCRPLNGQTTAVVGGTFSLVDGAGTVTMTVRQPPAHPRCRCWLSPVAPAVTRAAPMRKKPAEPPPPPKPTSDGWPVDPDKLVRVRSLGGSTGAQLVEDPATGVRYVLKRGATADHLRSEVLADQLYQALGANVPDVRLYESANGPVKLAKFIEGRTLGDLRSVDPAAYKAALQAVQKDFAADALLGNWDVIGLNYDNILVDASGKVWRIDNGGSLLFRAQGQFKSNWGRYVDELWTLRSPTVNQQTASVFGGLDYPAIAGQMETALGRRTALEALLKASNADPTLMANMAARLDSYADYVNIYRVFSTDNWRAQYIDDFTRHIAGLRNSGIVDKLPKELKNSGVYVKDLAGKSWDDLRAASHGERSIVHELAEYMQKTGGDYSFISYWESQQAGNSWNSAPQATKVFFAKQRTIDPDTVFWWKNGRQTSEDIYQRTLTNLGEQKYRETFTAFHAFNYEFVRNVTFKNNDMAAGLVKLIRTESADVMRLNNLRIGEKGVLTRGVAESTSIFETVKVFGTEKTVQSVPHHRIIGNYMLERSPGANFASFLGDNENEFVAMLDGLVSEYVSGIGW